MKLEIIDGDFAICKLKEMKDIKFEGFCFLSKTDDEISLVCEERLMPDNYIDASTGWKAFRIQGTMDFSMIGVLAGISNILANNQISIFVVSTFNTDYILVGKEKLHLSVNLLQKQGYEIA